MLDVIMGAIWNMIENKYETTRVAISLEDQEFIVINRNGDRLQMNYQKNGEIKAQSQMDFDRNAIAAWLETLPTCPENDSDNIYNRITDDTAIIIKNIADIRNIGLQKNDIITRTKKGEIYQKINIAETCIQELLQLFNEILCR